MTPRAGIQARAPCFVDVESFISEAQNKIEGKQGYMDNYIYKKYYGQNAEGLYEIYFGSFERGAVNP